MQIKHIKIRHRDVLSVSGYYSSLKQLCQFVEFACSLHACVGLLKEFRFSSTVEKHVDW